MNAVARWGNSLAVRLPKQIAEEARVSEGSPLELVVENGNIVLKPKRRRYTIEELVAQMKPENQHPLIEDAPRGSEFW